MPEDNNGLLLVFKNSPNPFQVEGGGAELSKGLLLYTPYAEPSAALHVSREPFVGKKWGTNVTFPTHLAVKGEQYICRKQTQASAYSLNYSAANSVPLSLSFAWNPAAAETRTVRLYSVRGQAANSPALPGQTAQYSCKHFFAKGNTALCA